MNLKLSFSRNKSHIKKFGKFIAKVLTTLLVHSTISSTNQYFIQRVIWCNSKEVPPLWQVSWIQQGFLYRHLLDLRATGKMLSQRFCLCESGRIPHVTRPFLVRETVFLLASRPKYWFLTEMQTGHLQKHWTKAIHIYTILNKLACCGVQQCQ